MCRTIRCAGVFNLPVLRQHRLLADVLVMKSPGQPTCQFILHDDATSYAALATWSLTVSQISGVLVSCCHSCLLSLAVPVL